MHSSARHLIVAWLLFCLSIGNSTADGPADNRSDQVRPIPPAGISVPPETRLKLENQIRQLGDGISLLRNSLANGTTQQSLLSEVEIFYKSVDWALRYNEFFRTNEFAEAQTQIDLGIERLEQLRQNNPLWRLQKGPLVRSYVSRIDQSIQPYGLVVPQNWSPESRDSWRLDVWFHGRGEQLSELAFIADRRKNLGEFAPTNAFVLHPYGRYCNGSRFAGETDFWEALADVKKHYSIDDRRIVIRGFSLGGASAWHMTAHHASQWVASAPGAGFSETTEFLRVFQKENLTPPPWEQKLWRWHDATSHAINFLQVPTVAYSGEKDSQIQAARAMEQALTLEGISLTHLIGPDTGHKYEANTKAEISRRIDALAALGKDPLPREIEFVTHTLKYPRMGWVELGGLKQHWEPARVRAQYFAAESLVRVSTTNVTALSLKMPVGLAPFSLRTPVRIEIDTHLITAPPPSTDRSWNVSLQRDGSQWSFSKLDETGLRKRSNLQGPIDDAFTDSFIFVRPTGESVLPMAKAWVEKELPRAVEHWRRHFRGDAQVKDDTQITTNDWQTSHLVLWGDPFNNHVLKKIIPSLPLTWNENEIFLAQQRVPASNHLAALIYPNPLNPRRYVVLNSGFTFRDYDYLNNARQTPKLPDWALIDLTVPPGPRSPGKISSAGFFDESWR